MLEKRGRRRKGLTLYLPLRLIVVFCIKLLILRPPQVKLRRLSGKRFLCFSLVLLHYDVEFPAFPHHPSALNKKIEFVSER